jgi:hypothetical protein
VGRGVRACAAPLFLLTSLPAFADEIDDCQKLGAEQIEKDSGHPAVFEIDRAALNFDKAEATIDKTFISSVLHGPAKLGGTGEGEVESVRFICLHGGTGKGALFFWLLPD